MSLRVLLVDDDPAATHVASRLLQSQGYHTHEVNASPDALAAAHAFSPDAVIVDFRMPYMTGADVAWQFAGDPLLKHIPLLICSASTDEIARSLHPATTFSSTRNRSISS